jgi:hypothetical protein
MHPSLGDREHKLALCFTNDNAICVLSAACRHLTGERRLKYFVFIEPAKSRRGAKLGTTEVASFEVTLQAKWFQKEGKGLGT